AVSVPPLIREYKGRTSTWWGVTTGTGTSSTMISFSPLRMTCFIAGDARSLRSHHCSPHCDLFPAVLNSSDPHALQLAAQFTVPCSFTFQPRHRVALPCFPDGGRSNSCLLRRSRSQYFSPYRTLFILLLLEACFSAIRVPHLFIDCPERPF